MFRIILLCLLSASLHSQDMTISQDSFYIEHGEYIDYGDVSVTNHTDSIIELSIGLERLCYERDDTTQIQLCLGALCFNRTNQDTIFGAESTFPFGEIQPISSFDVIKFSTFFETEFGSKWRVTLYNRKDTSVNASFLVQLENCGLVSNENIISDINFKMGPNPIRDKLHLDFSNARQMIEQLEIYSLSGRLLEKRIVSESQVTIPFTNYNAGIYIIAIFTNEGVQSFKVIKG